MSLKSSPRLEIIQNTFFDDLASVIYEYEKEFEQCVIGEFNLFGSGHLQHMDFHDEKFAIFCNHGQLQVWNGTRSLLVEMNMATGAQTIWFHPVGHDFIGANRDLVLTGNDDWHYVVDRMHASRPSTQVATKAAEIRVTGDPQIYCATVFNQSIEASRRTFVMKRNKKLLVTTRTICSLNIFDQMALTPDKCGWQVVRFDIHRRKKWQVYSSVKSDGLPSGSTTSVFIYRNHIFCHFKTHDVYFCEIRPGRTSGWKLFRDHVFDIATDDRVLVVVSGQGIVQILV